VADTVVSRLSVKVFPDTKAFGTSLEKYLTRVERSTRIKVPVDVDTSGIKDLSKQLPDKIPTSNPPKIPVELDPLTAAFHAEMRRQVAALTKQVAVQVPVNPATGDLRSELSAEIAALEKAIKVEIPTKPADLRQFERQLQATVTAAQTSITAKIPVEADTDGVEAAARVAKEAAERAGSPIKLDVDVDNDALSRLTGKLGDLGKLAAGGLPKILIGGATLAAATAGVASLTSGVAGLIVSLQTAAGAAVVLPAAFAGLKLVTAGLGFAAQDVGKAFSAFAEGDAKKFQKAIEQMSPVAKAFFTELNSYSPVLKNLRDAAQDNLFEGLQKYIEPLVSTYLPSAKQFLMEITASANYAVQKVAQFFQTPAAAADVNTTLGNTSLAFGEIAAAAQPAVKAIVDIVTVGSGQLPGLGAAVNDVANRFAEWISGLRETGQLQGFMEAGIATLKQLGEVAKNVGSIFGAIFNVAPANGGLLTGLERITASIAQWANSDAGQKALTSFFDTLAKVGSQAGPIITALADAIGSGLAPILGDLAVAIGPSVVTVIKAFGEGLKALQPAAAPVGQAIGALLEALAPIVPVIADVAAVLLTQMANGLKTFAQVAGPVIDAVAGPLSQAFVDLQPVFMQFGEALAPIAGQLGSSLEDAFSKLAGVLPELVSSLGGAFVDALPRLVDAFTDLAPVVADVAEVFADKLADVIVDLAPEMPALVDAFVDLAVAGADLMKATAPLAPIFADILGFLANLAGTVNIGLLQLKLLGGAIQLVGDVLGWLTGTAGPAVASFFTDTLPNAFSAVGSFFTDTIPGWFEALGRFFTETIPGWFTGLGDTISSGLSAAWDLITAPFEAAWQGLQDIAARGIDGIVAWIVELPFRALEGILNFAATMIENFTAMWSFITDLVGTAVGAVVDFVIALPGRVVAGVTALGTMIKNGFTDAWNWAKTTTSTVIDSVVSFATGLPGRISSAISSLVSTVKTIATNAWNGLKDAFTSGVNTAETTAKSLPGKITGALSGLVAKLKSIGSDIINGLVSGIQSGVSRVVSAAQNLANSIPGPIKSILGISSPSRLMEREIGRWIPAGIAEGMTGSLDVLRDSAQRMADTVSTSFTNAAELSPAVVSATTADGTGLAVASLEDALYAIANRPTILRVGSEEIARAAQDGDRRLTRRRGTSRTVMA